MMVCHTPGIEVMKFIALALLALTVSSTTNANPHFRPDRSYQAQFEPKLDWNRVLRGRTLRYLKTRGDRSIDKRMNLCSNGRFIFTDSERYSRSGANVDISATGRTSESGRWTLNDNRLILDWNDGSVSNYQLSRRIVNKRGEWGTFLNGERWLNVANKQCP